MAKKKSQWGVGDKILLAWIIITFVVGAFIINSAHKSAWEFPSGDKIGIFSAGMGEIVAPIWVPVLGLGWLITR